eukprot:12280118-Alexandrium_andersonii.AAC.1
MSASLVGSEMCIRDRAGVVAAGDRALECALGVEHGAQGSGQSGRRHGPVSYTHLTLPTICSV